MYILFLSMMRQCRKVGEGVYGEVFRTKRGQNSVALKVSQCYSKAWLIVNFITLGLKIMSACSEFLGIILMFQN